MKTKTNKSLIFMYFLIGLFVAYGIATIVFQIINHGSIFNCITVAGVCATFSLILFLSARGSWGKFLRHAGRHKEAETIEKQLNISKEIEEKRKEIKQKLKEQKKQLEESEKQLKETSPEIYETYLKDFKKQETTEKKTEKEKKKFNFQRFKKTLYALPILLIFGGAGAGILYFASTQFKSVQGENWIKTVATIQYVTQNVEDDDQNSKQVSFWAYVYYDEEDNRIVSVAKNNFAQISFKQGNQVTIYYNRQHPQFTKTLSTPIMLSVVGGFFLLVSLLATLLQSGFNIESVISILVGSIFAGMCVVCLLGMHFASGANFWQLILGGVASYALCCFGILGSIFVIFGFYKLFKDIYEAIKYRI